MKDAVMQDTCTQYYSHALAMHINFVPCRSRSRCKIIVNGYTQLREHELDLRTTYVRTYAQHCRNRFVARHTMYSRL